MKIKLCIECKYYRTGKHRDNSGKWHHCVRRLFLDTPGRLQKQGVSFVTGEYYCYMLGLREYEKFIIILDPRIEMEDRGECGFEGKYFKRK